MATRNFCDLCGDEIGKTDPYYTAQGKSIGVNAVERLYVLTAEGGYDRDATFYHGMICQRCYAKLLSFMAGLAVEMNR